MSVKELGYLKAEVDRYERAWDTERRRQHYMSKNRDNSVTVSEVSRSLVSQLFSRTLLGIVKVEVEKIEAKKLHDKLAELYEDLSRVQGDVEEELFLRSQIKDLERAVKGIPELVMPVSPGKKEGHIVFYEQAAREDNVNEALATLVSLAKASRSCPIS